jgi:DNA-binding GntR family transcriptional regulator
VSLTFIPLQPLKSGPLSLQAAGLLKDAIFAGQLKPGAPLRELHLARDLNVSQATVREALVQLERLGLVVRTPNIGTEVTRLSDQEIRERMELRALLEERALLEAAPRLTAPDVALLEARLDALGKAVARNDYFEQAQADLALHRAIWERAANRTLYNTLDALAVPLFAFVSILRGASRQTLRDVVSSHEGLVEALRRRDASRIREAVRQHFAQGLEMPGPRRRSAKR